MAEDTQDRPTGTGLSQAEAASRYLEVVRRCGPPAMHAWLEAVRSQLRAGASRSMLLGLYARARRRLGTSCLVLDPEAGSVWREAGLPSPHGVPLDEVGRIALLVLAAESLPQDDSEQMVTEIFRSGDTPERRALLRALDLLPNPERFRATAVEACRTNIQPIFEAIACENAYPSRYFTESEFNQMVLKALFLGVPLLRIFGLEARRTPALVRMAEAYTSERRAAGRSVPDDIAMLTPSDQRRR